MAKAYFITAVTLLVAAGKLDDRGRILVPAKTITRPPGTVMEMSDEQFDELEAEGAVRQATGEDIARAETDGKLVNLNKAQPPATSDQEAVALAALSRADLEKLASANNVDVSKARSKDDVIAAILGAGVKA